MLQKNTNVRNQKALRQDRVGNLVWARRTGGRLSAGDRLRLTMDGIQAQLARIPRPWRHRLGLPKASAPLDLDPLVVPDTAMAQVAEKALVETSPEPLVEHGYRTYAWGRILAAQARHDLDDELFYAACLLHDLGLVLADEERPKGSCCFAYDGAEAARSLLLGEGVPAETAESVADAICLHLNVRVGLEHGAEARYLNAGAALDVIGLGRRRIPNDLLERVLEKHPRKGWGPEIGPRLEREVHGRPGSRIHFLYRRFDFGRRAAKVRF